MIFICLSPLFLAVNIFYIYEICKWLTAINDAICANHQSRMVSIIFKTIKIICGVLGVISSIAIFIAFIMPDNLNYNNSPFLYALKRMLKLVGNYHLGVFIYLGMILVVVLLCRLIEVVYCKIRGIELTRISRAFNIRRSILGVVVVSSVVIITLWGVGNAGNIKTKYYDVTVNKEASCNKNLRIVMVADLHLGYNIGCEQMAKMVSAINAENPDLVIVAGDIFDNEYEALDDPERLSSILSSIESKYGTYAVYGNHDVSEKIIGGFTFNWKEPGKGSSDEMDAFLKNCGFNLLCDDYVYIEDSFYVYGRPDYERPGKWVTNRKTPEQIAETLDMKKPVIVVDHEPRELQELADAGVDIDLCGHTHDGQFFPMNLTSRYITWENSAGLLVKDNMANIVTSGVGLFGPNIRIGTDAEICVIDVHFEDF